MNLRKILMIGVTALATTAMAASTASAARYHHHYYRGYGAYAQSTGPGSQHFQNGSGWSNGTYGQTQYGHPDHW